MRILFFVFVFLFAVHQTQSLAQRVSPAGEMTLQSPVWNVGLGSIKPSMPVMVDLRLADRTSQYADILTLDTVKDANEMQRKMPRWVKWGLIGAAGGAVMFGVLGRMTIDAEPNPLVQDVAVGAGVGFVIVGGSIAAYDALCGANSRSRRAGLC